MLQRREEKKRKEKKRKVKREKKREEKKRKEKREKKREWEEEGPLCVSNVGRELLLKQDLLHDVVSPMKQYVQL